MKKTILMLPMLLCLAAVSSFGTNLANPTAPVPSARLSIGASYFIGGSTITNDSLPMMVNRVGVRAGYAPISYFNIGLDLGAVQLNVERYMRGFDTIPVFNSDVGWSVGGHIKASTPYFFNYVSLFGLSTANLFRAGNEYGAWYGGKEAVGVVGAQVRIPNFGYVSIGPQIHLMLGENKSYDSNNTRSYSNINNVRGWIAVDYFPTSSDIEEMMGGNKPYVTFEFSMSPGIGGSRRVPIQEFSLAISVGVVTKRLYGEDREALIDF